MNYVLSLLHCKSRRINRDSYMKYLILYLDGQGFIKEHKSKSDEPLADQNDLTEDVLQQNEKEITSVEFALVSTPL